MINLEGSIRGEGMFEKQRKQRMFEGFTALDIGKSSHSLLSWTL